MPAAELKNVKDVPQATVQTIYFPYLLNDTFLQNTIAPPPTVSNGLP